jgi:Fe-S oxidoreductase
MTTFLAERIDELGFSEEEGTERAVTYQDPCRLGRHLRIYDEPRIVLGGVPGIDLVEMEMSARNSRCCGTSGFSHCDAESRRLQSLRLENARETGAETMVTACPKCLIHFTCTQAENERRARIEGEAPAGRGIRTEDITVLVDSALQKKKAPAARREEVAAVKGEG